MATIACGVSHSQNLSKLIFDLYAVRCISPQQNIKLNRRKWIPLYILCIWAALMLFYFATFFLNDKLERMVETVLYLLLGIQLLVVNCFLLRIIKLIFETG